MSSSEDSNAEVPTVVLFQAETDESSVEPPMEEWSSLLIEIPEENKKRILHAEGLYEPGSGEICTKYITMSDSAVFRHPYYNYPSVTDPGIKEALLLPEDKIIYPIDGQDLYLALCDEMNVCPIRSFHKGLVGSCINLRYYGINPVAVRAMAMALRLNNTVESLDITDNRLSDDGCYHLGQMLIENVALRELIMCGCRIGAEGARRFFYGLPFNKSICKLDVSRNDLGDAGMTPLAKAIFSGISVKELNLSFNFISGTGAAAMAESLEVHNDFTHWNLSWNNLFTPGTYAFLVRLADNPVLQEVDLSWNSLSGQRIGNAIKAIMSAPLLRVLNLSNNKLTGPPILTISKTLAKPKKLITLDLSYNPLTPDDALLLLEKLSSNAVKVQQLLLDNVFVTPQFLTLRDQILQLKFRKKTVITYGGLLGGYEIVGPDRRELLCSRADFLTKKSKRNPIDICLLVQSLVKESKEPMTTKDFMVCMKKLGCPFEEGLIEEFANCFPGVPTPKCKTINTISWQDYMSRIWPDRKLPPTPPPEPEPPEKKKDSKKKKK